ncbi:hypothetical protein Btru_057117 [Bulinus truncatus]|nr:hypothetical protein Btru_057117 [Bulinus truncatus]
MTNDLNWTFEKETVVFSENVPKSVILELNTIQLLIIRDFVLSWYSTFSSDDQFQKEIKQVFHNTFSVLASRISKQPTKLLTVKFIQLYQHHLATFQKAKLNYNSHIILPGTQVPQDDKIKRFKSVEEAFGSLETSHCALQSETSELKYVRGIVSLLLISVADSHLLQGICVKTLLIEILTNKIFLPVIDLISDPVWLMELLIYLTSDEKITCTDAAKLSEPCKTVETDTNFSHKGLIENEAHYVYLENNDPSPKLLKSFESQETLQRHNNLLNNSNKMLPYILHSNDALNRSSFPLSQSEKDNSIAEFSLNSSPEDQKENNSDEVQCDDLTVGSQDLQSVSFDLNADQNSVSPLISQITESSEEIDDVEFSNIYDNPEEMSSSFPKLTSLKNFFVDSLKPGGRQPSLKKPKNLTLFTEDTSSYRKDSEINQNLPQVLVDGIPAECALLSSPVFSESDLTPSSGFFSSMHALFSLSSSSSQEFTSPIESPDVTPVTDGQFNINDITVIKESENGSIKPYISDDMRIFQDIAIPEAFPFRDEKSSSTYSLYTIEYEALYFTEEGKSVIRSGVVKRRHREFTNLQSRLEGQQSYKKYLKSIRVPNRLPVLPFKALDKTVETRRKFLEKYLKELISNEAICNGPDLREFLAYEGNSHIAFVKKSPDITVPRIDKILIRSVSGVMDRIRVMDRIKSFPSIPQEMITGLRGRDVSDEKLDSNKIQTDPDSSDFVSGFSDETFQVTDQANILVLSCAQFLDDHKPEDHFYDNTGEDQKCEQKAEVHKQEMERILSDLPEIDRLPEADSSDIDCRVILELLAQSLEDHWLSKDRVLKCLQSILMKPLSGSLDNVLARLTTEDQIVSYLKHLRESVWPQGHLKSATQPEKSEMLKTAIRAQAKNSLTNFFPEMFKAVIGKKHFENMIEVFLTSIECQQLNNVACGYRQEIEVIEIEFIEIKVIDIEVIEIEVIEIEVIEIAVIEIEFIEIEVIEIAVIEIEFIEIEVIEIAVIEIEFIEIEVSEIVIEIEVIKIAVIEIEVILMRTSGPIE